MSTSIDLVRELGSQVAHVGVIELEDVAGSRMRVHLKGYGVPDLLALSRSFWNGD